jgi:pyrimidine-specific ribonucleoside hydrolase
MKKGFIVSLLLILWLAGRTQPLPSKLTHEVIIDTDGAIDDMRAISLLLVRPEIKIRAVLTSDGSFPPDESVENLKSILHYFNHDDIPIAQGSEITGINPPWREFNRSIDWGETKPIKREKRLSSLSCLSQKLDSTKEKITIVCLGPLTNAGRLVEQYPSLLAKIERIIWYNESVRPLQGFNYECDRENADAVFRSGIRIDVISNLDKNEAYFDTSLYAVCKNSQSRLAAFLYEIHSQNTVQEKLKENHFRLCDELVSLYITNPELFDINTMIDKVNVRYSQDYNAGSIREALSDMIKGTYIAERNVVFNRFPADREMFDYDVREIMDSAISRYGYEEWKANVMTDEFHGHLGVFSIVGAKMGIRAREYFRVGPDMLKVISYAGSKPPYSCLNDGIQVSTGATLGMGTIRLSTDSIYMPSAIFIYQDHSVMITLKKEFLDQVDADINEGIVKFGLMDDGYWKLIRRNALKYWVEWDRDKIFDIVEIN